MIGRLVRMRAFVLADACGGFVARAEHDGHGRGGVRYRRDMQEERLEGSILVSERTRLLIRMVLLGRICDSDDCRTSSSGCAIL